MQITDMLFAMNAEVKLDTQFNISIVMYVMMITMLIVQNKEIKEEKNLSNFTYLIQISNTIINILLSAVTLILDLSFSIMLSNQQNIILNLKKTSTKLEENRCFWRINKWLVRMSLKLIKSQTSSELTSLKFY